MVSVKKELAKHMQIHQDRQFQCDICQKKFVTKDHLARHKLIHTDIRDHKCPVCIYTCKVQGNLRKHCQAVHKLDLERKRNVVRKLDENGEFVKVEEQQAEVVQEPGISQTANIQQEVMAAQEVIANIVDNAAAPESQEILTQYGIISTDEVIDGENIMVLKSEDIFTDQEVYYEQEVSSGEQATQLVLEVAEDGTQRIVMNPPDPNVSTVIIVQE